MKAVIQWVLRTMMKDQTGIVRTMPKKDIVDFNVAMTAERLMRNGIDPNSLKNANQVENAINQIEAPRNVQQGIKSTKSAKVFDLEGKEIDPKKGIMGGKQIPDDDLPPPGSRGGPDDIAAPVMNVEDAPEGFIDFVRKTDPEGAAKLQKAEDEIKAAIEAGNKRAAENLRKKKKKKDDDPEKKAYGGRIGFVKGTGLRFLQRVFGKEAFEEMKTRDPEMYVGLLEVVDMYRKRDKEGLKMYLQKFLPHMDDAQIEDFIRGSDGSEGLIGELIRLGSGRDYQGKIEMMKRAQEMRKLDDLEVTDEMIRKPNADGGIMRLGFKDGMNRRTFLKFLAGAASIPIVGKIFKPFKIGKTVTKVPIIKTDNVPGKPEWFDQLVNKVILEGDEVTKRFATKDREIVHMKVLDEGTGGEKFPPGTPGSDDTSIMVTQDLDAGTVRVEYRNPENVYEDPVQLQYKKPNPDEGDPRPSAEFDVAESGPVGRSRGPDDYEIELDEVGGTSISDLTSDVSKLKEYATGQKPTLKEFVQSKRRKDKAKAISEGGEDEMQAVIDRQGEFVQFDDIDPGDYASGGIARMLGE